MVMPDTANIGGSWRLAGAGIPENGPVLTFCMGHVFENGAAIATYSISEDAVLSFTAGVMDEEEPRLDERLLVRLGRGHGGTGSARHLPAEEVEWGDQIDGYVTIIKHASLGEVLDIGVARTLFRVE